jgi:predicted outer membrane protein
MESQVPAQEKLLSALDKKLIPNASNADLRRELEAFRARVEVHLEKAREIKRALEDENAAKSSIPAASPTIQ